MSAAIVNARKIKIIRNQPEGIVTIVFKGEDWDETRINVFPEDDNEIPEVEIIEVKVEETDDL